MEFGKFRGNVSLAEALGSLSPYSLFLRFLRGGDFVRVFKFFMFDYLKLKKQFFSFEIVLDLQNGQK